MRLLPLALLVFSALAGCSQPQPAEGPRAFYFWRTHLALSATEREALASLQVTRLFVHVFDVVRAPDGTVQPVGMLTWADAHGVPADVEVVPTIFIREAVFRGASEGDPQALARKTWAAVSRIARGLDKQVQELQLDCDWSDGSREGYFAFLRALHDVAGPQVRLSAPIRLPLCLAISRLRELRVRSESMPREYGRRLLAAGLGCSAPGARRIERVDLDEPRSGLGCPEHRGRPFRPERHRSGGAARARVLQPEPDGQLAHGDATDVRAVGTALGVARVVRQSIQRHPQEEP